MTRTQRYSLILGLGLVATGNWSAVAQTTPAGSPVTSLTVTIHVHSNAGVDQKTLVEAEVVAGGILRKAGIQTRWIGVSPLSDNKQCPSTEQRSLDLTNIKLNIFPRAMADHLQLSNEVIGLAPGTGRDRHLVYVFYDHTDKVEQRWIPLGFRGRYYVRASKIFGHAIAHEIGHVLLNMDVHSQAGIMRGNWGLEDLQEIASGRLLFTTEQAAVIRAEVLRRIGTHCRSSKVTERACQSAKNRVRESWRCTSYPQRISG